METSGLPKTLREAIRYFADESVCLRFVAQLRWPQGTVCPRCTSSNVRFMESRKIWNCRGCRKQFSVKVGTIFEDSPISLDKWLCAIWMIVNAKNGISSYEIGRSLGVTQKTAWFMMHRIRLALQHGSLEKLSGEVEVDETYIGGRARGPAIKTKGRKSKGPAFGKAIVMGMLERHGRVRTHVIENATSVSLYRQIKKNVAKGSQVFTDEWTGYRGLSPQYAHQVINHAEAYVKGNVHTNSIENFWSLLKRGIKGTYVAVEPFHLFRYLDEQAFRFNTRKGNDQERFIEALSSVKGRRVTYQQLIGQKGL